jgi:peptidoglycan/xylan/chitin deacetylase (PgdA/CDA1 family)
MSRRPSRRGFLAAVGAGSFALAGCTGLSGVGVPGGQDGTPTSTDTESPTTDQPTESPTTTSQPAEGPGTVVEDFEDLEAWGSVRGSYTADPKEAFAGSQSVRVENKKGGGAGIFKSFSDGLDLSKDNLSVAVKLEQPAEGKLIAALRAPGPADQFVSKRLIVKDLDDWVRVDLGYTAKDGQPDPSNVQEIRLMVLTEDEPVRFWVDDLRKSPKPDKGKVIFSFDDAHITQYDVAYQEMKKRGWSGVAAVIPESLGTPKNLTIGQAREMRDAGWDISSHPQESDPLTAFPKSEQRKKMVEARDWLSKRGFPDGSRFFFAPYNAVNGATLELVEELHEYGFTFGGCPNGAPPAGRTAISRVYGRDIPGAKRMVDMAEANGQLTVLTYHAFGPDYNVTLDEFVEVLDYVKTKNVDVITPSQLLEME